MTLHLAHCTLNDLRERCINIDIFLGGNFKIQGTYLSSQILTFIIWDRSRCDHITLISNNCKLYALSTELWYLLYEFVPHFIEWLPVCDIKHKHYCVCTPVVSGSNSPESFLPGRVPYLSLRVDVSSTIWIRELQCLYTEINTDRWDIALIEGIIDISLQDLTFSWILRSD